MARRPANPEILIDALRPALDGLADKLRSGARVAAVGCGRGATTVLLAQAYPASTFHGFDEYAESILVARRAAAAAGVSDRVTFEVAPAVAFPGVEYDLVCVFDALDALGDPVRVARHIRAALAPDGAWLAVESAAGGQAGAAECGPREQQHRAVK